jgi:hypothetical protein
MSESRVRENRMHGSIGGAGKEGSTYRMGDEAKALRPKHSAPTKPAAYLTDDCARRRSRVSTCKARRVGRGRVMHR